MRITFGAIASLLCRAVWAQGGDETCPAGAAGAACRANPGRDASSPARAKWSAGPAAPQVPHIDLITQEIEQLNDLIKLGEDKMALLKEVQGAAKYKRGLSEAQARALKEELPLLSTVASQGERTPIAAHEDFLVTKTIMEMESPVLSVRFLLLRNQRKPTDPSSSSSSSPTAQLGIPSCILVAAQKDGTVKLFSPDGELLLSFPSGHSQALTQLTVSPTHEEHLMATGDVGGAIRVHKVSVLKRRVSKEERMARNNATDEKTSQYLSTQLNVTVQFQREFQVPAGSHGEVPSLTSLALATHRGTRQVVAGDSEGRISIFAKNGTLRGFVDATAMEGPGVEGLHAHHSQLLFRAGIEWGYVNLEKLDVNHMDCPKFEGRVAAATVDNQVVSKVLLSDENGGVWVFNVKNKKDCELDRKILPATAAKAPVELASIKGFTIAMQKATDNVSSSLLALNMSQKTARRRPGEQGPGGHVVWRRQGAVVQDWSLQKRQQQGDLIALLSDDGREIEILELLMSVYVPAPTGGDPFGNMQMPIMGVAVVCLLGYQLMKQKGKGSSGAGGLGGLGGKGKAGNIDFASLASKRKAAGGLGTPGLGKK